MKIIIKKILFIGLIIFLLIQLYQPARNISFEQDITGNFTKVYNVPKNDDAMIGTASFVSVFKIGPFVKFPSNYFSLL